MTTTKSSLSTVVILGGLLLFGAIRGNSQTVKLDVQHLLNENWSGDQSLHRFRDHGITRPEDLISYLSITESNTAIHALYVMDALFVGLDESNSNMSVEALRVRLDEVKVHHVRRWYIGLILRHSNHQAGLQLISSIVDELTGDTLCSAMNWMAKQDRKWLEDDHAAATITALLVDRLRVSIPRDAASYSGFTALLATAVRRFPFNTNQQCNKVVNAFLLPFEHPANATLENLDVCFGLVMDQSKNCPDVTNRRVREIIVKANANETKLLLWQIERHCTDAKLKETLYGLAIQRWPESAAFVKELRDKNVAKTRFGDKDLYSGLHAALEAEKTAIQKGVIERVNSPQPTQ